MLITTRAFWFILLFIFTLTLIMLLYHRFIFEHGHGVHKITLLLYAAYLSGLIVFTLFPNYMLRPFAVSAARVNLVPFRSLSRFLSNPTEPIENLALFIPFGFFSVLNDKVKAGQRFLNAAWRSALISIAIEVFQIWIGRVSDIDDVMINTLGGMTGAALCILWHKTRLDHTRVGRIIMPELPKRWRGRLAVPALSAVVLVCYIAAMFAVNAVLTCDRRREIGANIYGREAAVAIEAENVMIVDHTSGETLFAEKAGEPIYPASSIKLITCLTALDIADPDERITPGSEQLSIPFDCSRAGIKIGTPYTLREMLYAALLPSGADACYAMGVYCGRLLLNDSTASNEAAIEAFVAAENEKLQKIGAVHTTVKNVEGIDEDGQLTTAKDLCLIAGAVLDNPILSEICATGTADIGPENDRIHLTNTNKILLDDSEFYSPDCIGIKTGSTSHAGNCLISAFSINGDIYITVVMNSGYYGKYTDTLTLYEMVTKARQEALTAAVAQTG